MAPTALGRLTQVESSGVVLESVCEWEAAAQQGEHDSCCRSVRRAYQGIAKAWLAVVRVVSQACLMCERTPWCLQLPQKRAIPQRSCMPL